MRFWFLRIRRAIWVTSSTLSKQQQSVSLVPKLFQWAVKTKRWYNTAVNILLHKLFKACCWYQVKHKHFLWGKIIQFFSFHWIYWLASHSIQILFGFNSALYIIHYTFSQQMLLQMPHHSSCWTTVQYCCSTEWLLLSFCVFCCHLYAFLYF